MKNHHDVDARVPSTPSFADLGVPTSLVRVLDERGITTPFPIQASTLPDSLAGRDVLGRGRTGSGKTLAFALPIVTTLAGGRGRAQTSAPRSLILVPTRELAAQVHEVVAPLAQASGLRTAVVIGGVGINPQIVALRRGVDVLIATPGRLEDLIGQRQCRLDQVQVSVLDEADHMADLGFLPAVKRLLDQTPRRSQRLLFSATLDRGVDVLVKRYLDRPVEHSVDDEDSHVPTMKHHVVTIAADAKTETVRRLLSGTVRTVAFTRTKHGAKALARKLNAAGIPAADLHGNLSQNARQRNLAAFESGQVGVLVATDIAARGIHVDDVGLVVHVDVPADHKALLHRSGRTARAGAEGHVVSVAVRDQARELRQLMKRAGVDAAPLDVAGDPGAVDAVTGPAREPVAVAARRTTPASSGAPASGGRPSGQGRPNRRRRGRGAGASGSSSAPRSGQGSRSGQGNRSGGQGGRRQRADAPARSGSGGAAAFSSRSGRR